MIRAALFDLDGTLVSSLPELAKGVEMLSRERQCRPRRLSAT